MRARAILVGHLLLALVFCVRASAQESSPTEYQIKAAFLFNFVKFVEWPAGASSSQSNPIVIGVLGDNPFGGDLARTVQGKSINDHPLVVQELGPGSELTNCQVLFISNSEKSRLSQILDHLKGASVLTIGEMDGFTEGGGMIRFVMQPAKSGQANVRFEINNEAAKSAHLKISSKLISLAIRTPP